MAELIEINPLRRRKTYVEQDGDDTVIREVFDERDAKVLVDRAHVMKRDGLGRGDNMRLSFSLLPFHQVEIREKYGLDCYDRNNWPAIARIVRTDYPHLIVNT